MIEKVRSCMEAYGMFPQNGNIVAGISGGADSVCLLRVLTKLRAHYGFLLTAVHINHRIRKEAGQDAAFVRSLCKDWDVPFVLVEEDVEALAAKEHISCEEAGRKVRYEAFERILGQMDAVSTGQGGCIAVAHNSDDRAETLLFHMLRGTGLNGMGSIRAVRKLENGSKIIRPLLFCTRNEIESFLRQQDIVWCTDATNSEDVYTRNKIRNRILPYACEQICERAKEHLAKEAQLLSETSDFVRRMTQEALKRCSRTEDGSRIYDVKCFGAEDPFLQQQMVLHGLLEAGTGRDLTAAHVQQAIRLFDADCQSGRRMEIPSCRVRVMRQFSEVLILPLEEKLHEGTKEVFLKEGRQFVPGLGEIFVDIFEISEKTDENQGKEEGILQDIPEKKYTKWFDYDKILESVVVRSRRTGDYLTINDAGSKKSLKRYLIEEKIPANRRDELLFLADGAHVVWVPGYRISAAYKVTAQTKKVLRIYITGGKEDGRES